MPVVDYEDLPEISMREGVAGKWISGQGHGATNISVLRNWVEPDISIPSHRHEYEEIVLVERGSIWVEMDGKRHRGLPGRAFIVPSRTAHAWGTLQGKAQVLFIWPVLEPFAAGKSTYLEGTPPTVA